MLVLNNIDIICADCRNPEKAIIAIENSCKRIIYKNMILFTDADIHHDWIQIVKIDKIASIPDYNKFMINELPKLVSNDFTLVVQADGFVTNYKYWDDDFLNYDYIGAPWGLAGCRVWKKKCRIGNGGFSLRSRNLMNRLKSVKDFDNNCPEDSFISDFIVDNNLSIPPTELAAKFSLECPLEDFPFDLTKTFGFHGTMIYDKISTIYPDIKL